VKVPLFVKLPAIFNDPLGAAKVLLTVTALKDVVPEPVMAVLPLKLIVPDPAVIVPSLSTSPATPVVAEESVSDLVEFTVMLLKLVVPAKEIAPSITTVPVPPEKEPPPDCVHEALDPAIVIVLLPAANVPAESRTFPLTVIPEESVTEPLLVTVRLARAVDDDGNSNPVFPVPVYVTL
jgi:hypothetical protein